MDFGLGGKVAVVTGAGGGIGEACASLFAREGARVACVDLNEPEASRVADEIVAAGGAAIAVEIDVADAEQVQLMVRRTVDQWGTVHILLNIAGVFDATPIPELSSAQWDRVMAINLRSVFACSQAVLPVMKGQRYGKIVSIASVAGQVGGIFAGANYSASKAGVMAFTKSLAKQVAGCNINVNTICPGPTRTAMARLWPAEAEARTLQNTPLGRLGEPEDIANAALFLASDLSSYIHGAHLDVNGGLYMD